MRGVGGSEDGEISSDFSSTLDVVKYSVPRGRHGQIPSSCMPENTKNTGEETAAHMHPSNTSVELKDSQV